MIDPIVIVLTGMFVVIGGIIFLRLHAFIALLIAAFVVGLITPENAIEQYALSGGMSPAEASRLAESSIGARIARAFGNTTAQIGILIAMAAVIGKCLLQSGAAERIVRSMIRVTGEEKSAIAFSSGSFFLAIPVFFDTVFYLMIPLAKATALRIGKNYLLLVLAIAGGAAMAHSLVPPTPGPLFLVSEMHIPIHMMMIGGIIVGAITVTSGYGYAVWANRKWPVPLRDSLEAPLSEMKAKARIETHQLPALWLSLLPILVPVVFISINGVAGAFVSYESPFTVVDMLISAINFIGEVNTALIAGGLIALFILVRSPNVGKEGVTKSIQEALSSGGMIILIIAAGGAFGAMLQQTGVSARIADLTAGYQMALIPLAFSITAVIRTAQGSATVAMITAAGILSGMASSGNLGFHVLYLGLAVACGSKLIPWMNDSGFWIVCKMSTLTEVEALKTFSVMMTIMGITGVVVILIAAWLFPLV